MGILGESAEPMEGTRESRMPGGPQGGVWAALVRACPPFSILSSGCSGAFAG